MDDKEKALLKRINSINSMVIDNMDKANFEEVNLLLKKFENDLQRVFERARQSQVAPIWMSFSNMTAEQIRQEFNNVEKYPSLDSIKAAVKGYLDLKTAGKVKTRETLIEHIIKTYQRGSFISKIGKEK